MEYIFVTSVLQEEDSRYCDSMWPGVQEGGLKGIIQKVQDEASCIDNHVKECKAVFFSEAG